MISAIYTQGGAVAFTETPLPVIGEDEVLLRVDATSICGTDIKIARHGHRKLQPGQRVILGHEFVGTIQRAGLRVRGYEEGQRFGVAPNIGCGRCEMCARGLMNMCQNYSAFGINIDGAHTEFVKIPAAALAQGSLIPLESGLSAAQAALAEPLSCAVNGVRVSNIRPGDSVLIFGAGPMGLFNLMVAVNSGASQAFVIDLDDTRLEKARALGATRSFNSSQGRVREWVMDETQSRGVDAVIIAVPVAQLQADALQLLAPFGRLCLFAGLATGQSAVPLDTNIIHYKNLVVTGMSGGTPQDYQSALRMIAARRVDVSQVTSHVFPIQELDKAYDVALSGKGLKVVMVAAR